MRAAAHSIVLVKRARVDFVAALIIGCNLCKWVDWVGGGVLINGVRKERSPMKKGAGC